MDDNQKDLTLEDVILGGPLEGAPVKSAFDVVNEALALLSERAPLRENLMKWCTETHQPILVLETGERIPVGEDAYLALKAGDVDAAAKLLGPPFHEASPLDRLILP